MGPWTDAVREALLDESTDDLYEHGPCGYLTLLPDGMRPPSGKLKRQVAIKILPPAVAAVMELIEGEDLSQRIARGRIPIDEALAMAKQIAEALEQLTSRASSEP